MPAGDTIFAMKFETTKTHIRFNIENEDLYNIYSLKSKPQDLRKLFRSYCIYQKVELPCT